MPEKMGRSRGGLNPLNMNRLRRMRSRPLDVEAVVSRAYEQHAGAIGAYALRRTAASDAADVVADTFLVAWRRHEEMPDEPHTLPWLYGVARRVLANQRRSRDRRTRLHDRLRTEFVEFDMRSERVEDTEHFQRVASAMTTLSDDDAELLRLTAWEELTPTQLATAMELEPSAVRQRLRRARQRLRSGLADGLSNADASLMANCELAGRQAWNQCAQNSASGGGT